MNGIAILLKNLRDEIHPGCDHAADEIEKVITPRDCDIIIGAIEFTKNEGWTADGIDDLLKRLKGNVNHG